jgi:hypothetical protein
MPLALCGSVTHVVIVSYGTDAQKNATSSGKDLGVFCKKVGVWRETAASLL